MPTGTHDETTPGTMDVAPAPASVSSRAGTLRVPVGVADGDRDWPAIGGLAVYHLLALLAFLPWFFSWTGVALGALGMFVYGTLGINLCYHRLLTHRGLLLPKWLERTFVTLGVCCLQDTPGRWVAIHRLHHRHVDEQRDPHSPLVTLLWGHMGWIIVKNLDTADMAVYGPYARDVLRDPYYLGLEQHDLWLVWINLAQWLIYFGIGFSVSWFVNEQLVPAIQFGLSAWLWGVIVRTVVVWHITWSVNSLAHRWGYQTYATGDNSRNNWFVAWISNGEGWHNNHHADPAAAAHCHHWWEFDVTWRTIQLLECVGLATNVVRPKVWSREGC